MRFLDTSRIRVRLHQRVPAGDGNALSVDLYMPPEPGRYPVLFTRTAADNNRMNRATGTVVLLPSSADRCKAIAAQGFIVATGDVRGRGDSDGEFRPFANEGADGVATIAWLRALRECDGKVGAFGSGYGAFCAWAAIAAGARIDAIASVSPFGAIGEGLVHRGGVVRLDWLFWMHLVGGRTLQPPSVPPWPKIYKHLPLRTMNTALGHANIEWQQWMDHLDAADPYWASVNIADKISKLSPPGLHVTGWWDGQLTGARYYYEAAQRSGPAQSLIVGPWDTAAVRHPAMQIGGTDFGPRSLVDFDETLVDFFGAHLRGERNAWSSPRSRIFVTGRNEWMDGWGWPDGVSATAELHLSSDGAANTRRGDGSLNNSAPIMVVSDEITHNATMPVDFQANFKDFAANTYALSLDQGHITARDEALVYTAAPLKTTLTVMGRPVVTLTVSSDSADADLFVLLSDVFPLGARDLHLSHAALRLSTRKDFRAGEPVTLTLELDELAHDFLPGHSLRITVTPSLFPLYARNTHHVDYVNAAALGTARIQLHHGGGSRGSIRLPVDGAGRGSKLTAIPHSHAGAISHDLRSEESQQVTCTSSGAPVSS